MTDAGTGRLDLQPVPPAGRVGARDVITKLVAALAHPADLGSQIGAAPLLQIVAAGRDHVLLPSRTDLREPCTVHGAPQGEQERLPTRGVGKQLSQRVLVGVRHVLPVHLVVPHGGIEPERRLVQQQLVQQNLRCDSRCNLLRRPADPGDASS